MNYKISVTAVAAAVLNLTLLGLCHVMSDSSVARGMNLIVVILGCALGWFTGVLATPYNQKERSHFEFYARSISLFLSSYALAKSDRVVEQLS